MTVTALISMLLAVGLGTRSAARAVPNLPSHPEPYFVDSFEHDNYGESLERVFRDRIVAPGAYWLRLHFSDYELGEGSFVRIVSLVEEAEQVLRGKDLPHWGHSSAYFNGDAVEVELWAEPGDEKVFFRIETITVGEWPEKSPGGDGDSMTAICGSSDSRTPSTDPRVARLSFVDGQQQITGSCTAYIAPNGALISAGHCVQGGLNANDLVEFDVPDSQANGDWNFAHPNDQYPIDLGTEQWDYTGPTDWGNDWAVFGVLANSNTQLFPAQAQGDYVRLTREIPSVGSSIRVTGCGDDSSDGQGHRSYTVQTGIGQYRGEVQDGTRFYHTHWVDTEGGSSGSPILEEWSTVEYAIGVHTSGGCDIPEAPYNGTNKGTSFEHLPLRQALDGFLGPDTVFVDTASAAPKQDGTIVAPCLSVSLCADWVLENGILSIARGYYDESVVIDTPCTVLAPVGPVVIGEPEP
jgi:V8-like Glu-specific endopeptidase